MLRNIFHGLPPITSDFLFTFDKDQHHLISVNICLTFLLCFLLKNLKQIPLCTFQGFPDNAKLNANLLVTGVGQRQGEKLIDVWVTIWVIILSPRQSRNPQCNTTYSNIQYIFLSGVSLSIIKLLIILLILEDRCHSIRFKPGPNRCQHSILLIINKILYLNNTS